MTQATKYRTLWPLPGGTGQYLATATAILGRAASSTSAEALLDWFLNEFELDSRRTAQSYIRVLHALGLIELVGLSVYVTTDGQRFLETGDVDIVRRALTVRISGVDDVLELLGRRPLRIGALTAAMKEAGYDWSTDSQVRYRLRWLEEVGLVSRHGKARPEYRLTAPWSSAQ